MVRPARDRDQPRAQPARTGRHGPSAARCTSPTSCHNLPADHRAQRASNHGLQATPHCVPAACLAVSATDPDQADASPATRGANQARGRGVRPAHARGRRATREGARRVFRGGTRRAVLRGPARRRQARGRGPATLRQAHRGPQVACPAPSLRP